MNRATSNATHSHPGPMVPLLKIREAIALKFAVKNGTTGGIYLLLSATQYRKGRRMTRDRHSHTSRTSIQAGFVEHTSGPIVDWRIFTNSPGGGHGDYTFFVLLRKAIPNVVAQTLRIDPNCTTHNQKYHSFIIRYFTSKQTQIAPKIMDYIVFVGCH